MKKLSDQEEHPYPEACSVFPLSVEDTLRHDLTALGYTSVSNDEGSSIYGDLGPAVTYWKAKSLDEENLNLNIYQTRLPGKTNTANGAELKDFFTKIKQKIEERIKNEREATNSIKSCLQKSDASVSACVPVSHDLINQLIAPATATSSYSFEDVVVDARFHLLLASDPSYKGFPNYQKTIKVNADLKSYGVDKEVDWKQAKDENNTHQSLAEETLKKYTREAHEKHPFSRGMSRGEIRRNHNLNIIPYINARRLAHQEKYSEFMMAFPLLQYTESAKPDVEEVKGATDKVLESLDKEEAWLKEASESLNSNERLSSDILKLLNYSDIVSETLQEMPEYCGISKDLRTIYDAKDLGKAMGIYLPIMAASFFNPSAAFLAVGGGASAGVGVSRAHSVLQEERLQTSGRISPLNPTDVAEVQQRKTELTMEVVMAPFGIYSGKAINRGVANAGRGVLNRLRWRKRPAVANDIEPSISSSKTKNP